MKRWLTAALATLIVVALVISLARKARLPRPRPVRGTPISLIARDPPPAQFEADERAGGHRVYVTLAVHALQP